MLIKKSKINIQHIKYIILFLYFVSFATYHEAIFTIITFFLLLYTIFFNKKITISNILIWGIVFWSYYFLSLLWAKNEDDLLEYITIGIQMVGLYIVIPSIVKKESHINVVLKLLFFSLIYTAVLLIIKTPIDDWGSDRVGLEIGLHPNNLGLRMSTGVLFSLYYFHKCNMELNKKNSIKKMFYIIIAIIFATIALFSGSKKALVLLVVGSLLFETCISKGVKAIGKFLIFTVIGISILFLIFNNKDLYEVMGKRVEGMFLTIIGEADTKQIDASLVERTFYMKQAMHLFSLHPILGYGGNNFKTYMRELNYSHIAYSHNNFTELLSTLGIIGFLIYYSYWIYILISLFKGLKKDKNKNLTIMFIILVGMILLLDYGNVSYENKFNAILLCIISIYIAMRKEKDIK